MEEEKIKALDNALFNFYDYSKTSFNLMKKSLFDNWEKIKSNFESKIYC